MPGNLRYNGTGGSQKPHSMSSRTMSLDSLNDRSTILDQKIQEYLPTRVTRTTPKANEAAMQFVKTGPAGLYKIATEQIKKAEAVKEARKHIVQAEEVDWQQPSSSSSNKNPYDEGSDWQSNLDKWKSSRRKRNEEALGRVIEIKKNEQEDEMLKTRRKSKTFGEMRDEKNKRGRRYNLVVHDDDNSDLGGLGLSLGANKGPADELMDQDNKDAKSDAGFCTGSDTGSDGVFAEDNISDTSSALGDKKEAHDSLLDTGVSKDEEPHINGHSSTTLITQEFTSTSNTTTTTSCSKSSIHTDEYTYDKAIAGYKQYAENSAKKRTSSITSLNSNTSYTKEEDKKEEKFGRNNRSPSPNKSKKLEGMVNFFSNEIERDTKTSPEPRIIMREKSPKVDVGKRRSMFESRDPSIEREQKQGNRRSLDMSGSLKNRVASFENLDTETTATSRVRGLTPTRDTNLRKRVASFERLDTDITKYKSLSPPRDTKFQDKLATFTTSETEPQQIKKKTPERDVNFHKKRASFTSMKEERESVERNRTLPQGDPSLKNKIASFEQLEIATETHIQASSKEGVMQRRDSRDEQIQYRDRSISLENLDEPQTGGKLRPSQSMGSILRRTPSTPYMVVELEPEKTRTEKQCETEVRPAVNAQVFAIASKLQETPLLGSPVHKAPSLPLPTSTAAATACDQDSLEVAKPYTDDDINEVMKDYETVDEGFQGHADNIYENITDEPLYENIYEKVGGDDMGGNTVDHHHYQTLEEVRGDAVDHARLPPSPPSPPPPLAPSPLASLPKAPSPFAPPASLKGQSPLPRPSSFSAPLSTSAEMVIPEVLDVTWTDNGPSQAAPPSEPPPPPPPDDDDDSDSCDNPSLSGQQQQQEEPEQEEDEKRRKEGFTRENSTRRLKKELYRRMSNFLGTSSSYIEEENSVKPPPDLADLLRQEREAERNMCGGRSPTQQVLMEAEIARREREIIQNVERSELLKQQLQKTQQGHSMTTMEEHATSTDNSEFEEHMQYQESPHVLDAKLSTNSPHTGSHSVSEYPKSQLTHDSMDSSHAALESFVNTEMSSKGNICIEKQTNESENWIRYDRVESSYETVETSDTEQRYSEVLGTLAPETSLNSLDSNSKKETEWELSDRRDFGYAKVSPRPASLPVAPASSQPEEYKKLAELEEEMLRHDKDMLRRAGLPPTAQPASTTPSPALHLTHTTSNLSTHTSNHTSTHTSTQQHSTHQHLPIQEFYTAPAYESTPPASLSEGGLRMEEQGYRVEQQEVTSAYRTEDQVNSSSPTHCTSLTSLHPFSRSNSQGTLDASPASHTPLQAARSSPATGPEPLPRRRKAPLPSPTKTQKTADLNTAERREALRVSRMTSNEPQGSDTGEGQDLSSSSGQQMSKQTLLALSAIPKSRLTENESWVTKKKAEAQKRDYSKHWLHQEAEQRRLEQQDRISRPVYTPAVPSQSSSPPQQKKHSSAPQHSTTSPTMTTTPFHQSTPIYPPQTTTTVYSSYPQALKNPSPVHNNNINNNHNSINNNTITNNNINNSWRNQATTYQPHIPAPAPTSDKALPDAIIHNLTQRVGNKSKSTYNNSGGRLSSNSNSSTYSGHRDDNYHDYMNTDALSSSNASPPGHSPLYQGPGQASPSTPLPQDSPSTTQQDQRLLSVSGKKKCSHCAEELGRGAAMIIESLRLFYHIPCFKCCVCGIQLGNGSAGADVRVRNHKLHCHNCYSNDEGMKFSKV